MPAAPLLLSTLLALPWAGNSGPSLNAAAAAAARPPECKARVGRAIARGPSVWERARVPTLQRYCDLIARAHAQLASRPEAAREAAKLAEEALPGRAAPLVVLARVALALGAPAEAARDFSRARAIDPRSVEDPSTMHDLARTLRLDGKRDESLAIYRALVPRIDLLGSLDRRVAALLEAAHVAMAVAAAPATPTESPASANPSAAKTPAAGAPSPSPPAAATAPATSASGAARPESQGRAPLDEAAAYLREARLRPPTQLTGDVLLSLALVLDRSGDATQAEAALDSAAEASARPRASGYLVVDDDRLALEALSLERTDPGGAAEKWHAFLATPSGKGPWAAAAQARLAALPRGAAAARRQGASAPPRQGAKQP
ncbi:hypothetical protein [Chondromyces crocatus]|uniref:hypothetical protein n=1 Tax=Chondromyces crocatus TaxID=52 RepID=UPI0012E11027|nr:hypothetical protein [Chondromyces crocatus]